MRTILIALLMTLATQVGAAEFFVLPNTKTLLMMGETEPADGKILSEYIETEGIDALILKGPGGDLDAGYFVAYLVLEKELDVTVPSNTECASACSLIFVAGKKRMMEEGARLGFHLPFLDLSERGAPEAFCQSLTRALTFSFTLGHGDVEKCLQKTYQLGLRDIRKLQKLLIRDGIDEQVLELVINTPSNTMTWIDVAGAKRLGLINNNSKAIVAGNDTKQPDVSDDELHILSNLAREALRRNWNVIVGSPASKVVLTVRLEFDKNGTVRDSMELISSKGGDDKAVLTAFRAAKTAIKYAAFEGAFKLPSASFDGWKVLELEFDPNEMRKR